MTEYLQTEEVCGFLARAGVPIQSVNKVFCARLQPEVPEGTDAEIDYEKIYVLAVPEPGGQVYLVRYKFNLGNPFIRDRSLDIPQEKGRDWRPRWLSVEGPYQLDLIDNPDKPGFKMPDPECEVMTKAREFTSGRADSDSEG